MGGGDHSDSGKIGGEDGKVQRMTREHGGSGRGDNGTTGEGEGGGDWN